MKKIKFRIIGIIILLFIASFTPSCDALLQAINDTSQVDNNSNNNNKNNKKKTNDADSNGQTSLGKKSGGGIYNFIQ